MFAPLNVTSDLRTTARVLFINTYQLLIKILVFTPQEKNFSAGENTGGSTNDYLGKQAAEVIVNFFFIVIIGTIR